MKKIIFFIGFLSMSLLGKSQFDIDGDYSINGKLGIGTDNPSYNLHLTEDGNIVYLTGYSYRASTGGFGILGYGSRGTKSNPTSLESGDNTLWLRGMGFDGVNYHRVAHIGLLAENVSSESIPGYISFQTNSGNGPLNLIERMRINSDGNVGIGTIDPSKKLTINSGDMLFTGDRNNIIALNGDNTVNKPMMVVGEQQSYGVGFKWDNGLNLDIVQFDGQDFFSTEPTKLGHFRVRDKVFYWAGNVGVGTDSPDYKMDVAGTIRACEVKVDLNSGECPDYVFADNYDLMSLETLEEYVTKNKHLPKINPSDKMESEGIDLKDMNIKLLEKMEEMSLYMIDMNKRVKSLENENKELKDKITKLESVE